MQEAPAPSVEQLLRGEPRAVAVLEAWVRRIASSYRARLGEEWEDAVQAAVVEVYGCLRDGAYSGTGSLRGYVWRLVSHSCLDRLRRRKRWQWVELDPEAVTQGPAAFRRIAEEQGTRRILEIVERCPEGCRQLWRMVLAGMSYREMSARLGVSEGALRVRVLRCRRRALELLEETAAESDASRSTHGQDREGQHGDRRA